MAEYRCDCHGYCGLPNTKLSDGTLLVAGRRLTGFAWSEEVLAGVARKVPYNAEEKMKRRGALYEKAWLPFISKVVTDGRLVTGQNPQSAKATASQVAALYPESAEFVAMPEVFATGFLVGFLEWACIKAINPHRRKP